MEGYAPTAEPPAVLITTYGKPRQALKCGDKVATEMGSFRRSRTSLKADSGQLPKGRMWAAEAEDWENQGGFDWTSIGLRLDFDWLRFLSQKVGRRASQSDFDLDFGHGQLYSLTIDLPCGGTYEVPYKHQINECS